MTWVATAIAGSAIVSGVVSNNASRRAADASRGASDAAALQAQIGAEQWDRYKEIYTPLEKQYVSDAQNYDTPEQYQRAAGEAQATTASEFAKARDRLERTPGMDPSAPNAGDMRLKLELAQAATGSTAQNAARDRVRNTAWARRTDALSLGNKLPANASSALSSAASGFNGIASNQYSLASAQANAAGTFGSNMLTAARQNGWLGNTPSAAAAPFNTQGIQQGYDPGSYAQEAAVFAP